MEKSKLKPCKCGNPVEVKYIAGLGGSLLNHIQNRFAGSTPAYYIHCEKCDENLCIRLKQMTVTHRDKCRRELIKAWNRRATAQEGAEQ